MFISFKELKDMAIERLTMSLEPDISQLVDGYFWHLVV